MSCPPSYSYAPAERPIPSISSATVDNEHRSRLFIGGTFFRSIEQGRDQNDISLEVILTPAGGLTENITLNVRVLGTIQETFTASQTFVIMSGTYTGGINALRATVGSGAHNPSDSKLIEMYPRGIYPAGDFFDITGADVITNGISAFLNTQMINGDGPPSNATQPYLDSIFSGPQRTMAILITHEDVKGFPRTPPPSKRVQQYDGTNFISYCNDVQGACPLDGTCSP